jgi:magnesium-transporting ATPase (P-type)
MLRRESPEEPPMTTPPPPDAETLARAPAAAPPRIPPAEAPAHALAAESVLSALDASPDGLDEAEAARRLARFGPNRLPEPERPSALSRFLRQFSNLLIQVLLGAAAVSLLIGHALDAAVILAVVALNAITGFVQEGRAERALEAVRDLIAPRATVLRRGQREGTDAATLVPGDVVVLEPGDRAPADARILSARALRVQEAALTGESEAAAKDPAPVAADAALGDRTSMIHAGTLIAAGQGTAVVTATGAATEIGRIGVRLAETPRMDTPLLRAFDRFARLQTLLVFGVAAVAFAVALLVHGLDPAALFMAMVSLAVAAIPEGLPTILTVTLAIGVNRMARRNAVVRRLPVVEALGSVGVICTDKTGTLTRNEMTVADLALPGRALRVTGEGYAPEGAVMEGDSPLAPGADPRLGDAALCALLCNDAGLSATDKGWSVAGDPMEGALIAFALKAGLDATAARAAHPRRDALPFDAAHRLMATLNDGPEGPTLWVKGAPEAVLAACAAEAGPDGARPLDAAAAHGAIERLAAEGRRVMALARGPAPAAPLDPAALPPLTLIGLVGLVDPPREAAVAAVAACRSAGVRVIMITGDHAGTALAIARAAGLRAEGGALTGREIDALDDAALARRLTGVDVCARADPGHKVRLVEALQAGGAQVAMTGDGVNDALALMRADVGVAMGRSGSEAAKEAAEIVLLDDDFATIVAAIRQGRVVYDNLRKAVTFLLPINGGESLSLLAAILLGLTLPIAPLQILWVNMVSSIALALTLAFEPAEPGVMARPPRAPGASLLDAFLWWRVAAVSTLFSAGIFGGFWAATAAGLPHEAARTVAVNTLVAMEIFYLFSVRYLNAPSFTAQGVRGTTAVLLGLGAALAAQAAFTYAPPFAAVFETRPLSPLWLGFSAGCGALVFAALEVEKALLRRRA